jgi:hypothetical protein
MKISTKKVPILITVTKLSVEDKILSFSFEPLNALSIKLRALKKMPSLGVLQQNHNLMDSLRFCEKFRVSQKDHRNYDFSDIGILSVLNKSVVEINCRLNLNGLSFLVSSRTHKQASSVLGS